MNVKSVVMKLNGEEKMIIIKCPKCKRELEFKEEDIMKLCRCGEIVEKDKIV